MHWHTAVAAIHCHCLGSFMQPHLFLVETWTVHIFIYSMYFASQWPDSVTHLLQICLTDVKDANIRLILKVLSGVQWPDCHVQRTSLRWVNLCNMVCCPPGSSCKKVHTVDLRDGDDQQQCCLHHILQLIRQWGFFSQSFIVQFWWGCVFVASVSCGLAVKEQQPVWSSAALSASRLDTTDDLLHTSFGTSGYLTYCRLSVSSNPSAHSALNFGISKTL